MAEIPDVQTDASGSNRGEVASDRGGSCVRSFPLRGGDTHAAEDLCVQDI